MTSPQASAGSFTPRATGFWLYTFLAIAALAWILPYSILQHADFRTFYAAGKLLATDPRHLYTLAAQTRIQNTAIGEQPIALAFLHPAYEALLYRPLAALSFRSAYFVFLFCNALLLAAAFALAPPVTSPPLHKWSRSFLFLLFFPTLLCALEGQDSFLFLLLMCLVWRSLARNHDRAAGIFLGLALFKLQLVLILAALLTGRRGLPFLKGFLPTAAAVAALCIWITGPAGFADFLHLLGLASLATTPVQNTPDTVSVWPGSMPNLFGLLYACGARFLAPRMAFAIDLTLSAILFVLCAWKARTATSLAAAFSIAICCALLLSHHLFLYDYTLLLLPILLLNSRGHSRATAAAFLLPVTLFFLFHGRDWAAAILPFLFLWEAAHSRSLISERTTC